MSRILPLNSRTVPLAYEALKRGELIVLPTDTVYGVAAALTHEAINGLYEAKSRPMDKPIPVLLSDASRLDQVCDAVPGTAHRLAEAFWPGALTIVLPKKADLPANLTPLPTVGVRVPDHDLTRAVIRAAGGALAVTSANESGGANTLSVQAAFEQLGAAVAYYMEDGPAPGGTPSTVITFEADGAPRILREGPITMANIEAVLRV
jgi:L-threonylcarbamoyladenylate synthase